MGDKLTTAVGNIALAVEQELQLNETNSVGLQKAQMDLSAVLNHCKSYYASLAPAAVALLNKKIQKCLEPLYRLTSMCQFKEASRLDFSEYKGMNKIAEILSLFTVESAITQNSVAYCNVIASALDEIDDTKPACKSTLSYKYLRLFLIFVLLNNFVAAACIATFLITQIAEGV